MSGRSHEMSSESADKPTAEELLGYDPGCFPTRPSPSKGETITMVVDGLPPYKDLHFSIRNKRHKAHNRFKLLRSAGLLSMDGRARYSGPVQMDIEIRGPQDAWDKTLSDYASGISDALDGSAGPTFTFLPIVYQDDCQLVDVRSTLVEADSISYAVKFTFL